MWVLWVSLLLTLADQASKQWVRWHFYVGESRPVVEGFFDLTYVRNPGAAWGIFGGQTASLTLLSLVLLAVMLVFRRSFLSDTWEHRLALGCMIGGIVGNLLDRVRLGWVTDFFDFHWKQGYHFPCFNIADSAICVGVGIYLLSSLWLATHPLREPARSAPPPEPHAPAS